MANYIWELSFFWDTLTYGLVSYCYLLPLPFNILVPPPNMFDKSMPVHLDILR